MTSLNRSTLRRLQKLPQVPNVWEGDRRSITPGVAAEMDTAESRGDCILWVDGSEGIVRAMDLVSEDVGHEAVVRTLLRAMEYPHSSTAPCRPKKIVVCDREIQFFLRGVLQDLDITVDYQAGLPLIEEIFRGLQEATSNRPPQLPPEREEALMAIAQEIWEDAPWVSLDEEKILSVKLDYGDTDTLYISILGMLGMEYGILMYRSVDSLKMFRQRVLSTSNESTEALEQAFLDQDCFFLTFDFDQPEMDNPLLASLVPPSLRPPAEKVEPAFGNLHPLEGMRPVLYEEEAATVQLALTALHRFFQQNLQSLSTEEFPPIHKAYRLPDPANSKQKVSVKVATMPDLAEELFELTQSARGDDDEDEFGFPPGGLPILRDDLIPRKTFYSLGAMPWEVLEILRATVKHYQPAEKNFPMNKADGFPVVILQTTRPKAMTLIEELQAADGLQAICFNPGADPFGGMNYDLGILQAGNGELHLFGEFDEDDPTHIQAREKWDNRCKKTKGVCGLVIAMGVTGANRGNPGLKDMLALFEARSLSSEELGLGPLELMPHF